MPRKNNNSRKFLKETINAIILPHSDYKTMKEIKDLKEKIDVFSQEEMKELKFKSLPVYVEHLTEDGYSFVSKYHPKLKNLINPKKFSSDYVKTSNKILIGECLSNYYIDGTGCIVKIGIYDTLPGKYLMEKIRDGSFSAVSLGHDAIIYEKENNFTDVNGVKRVTFFKDIKKKIKEVSFVKDPRKEGTIILKNNIK